MFILERNTWEPCLIERRRICSTAEGKRSYEYIVSVAVNMSQLGLFQVEEKYLRNPNDPAELRREAMLKRLLAPAKKKPRPLRANKIQKRKPK